MRDFLAHSEPRAGQFLILVGSWDSGEFLMIALVPNEFECTHCTVSGFGQKHLPNDCNVMSHEAQAKYEKARR